MDKSSRQKISKEVTRLKWNIRPDWMDLIDYSREQHTHVCVCVCVCVHKIFSRMDHILGHKTCLSEFKKTESISHIFSKCNTMSKEINYKIKMQNIWTHGG